MSPSTVVSAPNLAYAYQEILTVVARLRSRKFALPDSAVFRTQVRRALEQAESAAQSLAYSREDIRLASFAVIALLDETILNSSNPAFRDWAQKPLMLDLYGTLNAGETCFENMRTVLKRDQFKPTIDLLEVYVLCLALGFRGRYSSGSEDQLRSWRDPMVDLIVRNRGGSDRVELSRFWLPEANVEMPPPSNRLTRLALSSTVAVLLTYVVLWTAYHFMLVRGSVRLVGIVTGKAE